MIVIEEHQDLLRAHVYAQLTLDDLREFEEAVTGGRRKSQSGQCVV